MRRLIIILLVLAGLAVAADFGAAALAESAVSRQMRTQLGLVDDPSVRVNGFPFLTQAVTGRYPSIDVDAKRIPYGSFKELEITAQLHGVTAPLSMLLGSGQKTIEVAGADGTVKIDAADLERLVPQASKVRIETIDKTTLQQAVKNGADPSVANLDPDRAARLVGTVSFFGASAEIAEIATLELSKGKATIVPVDVRLSDGSALPVPASIQKQALNLFRIPLYDGNLPFNVTASTFKAKDGTLQISGTATNLTLD
jgi:LmeA-like phospholipid-binding